MAFPINCLFVLLITITSINCASPNQQVPKQDTLKQEAFKPKEIHRSENIYFTQITANSFIHTSYKQTQDYGNVPCNGLIVRNNNEVIIFDTPTNDTNSEELIKWIDETLKCKINAIIPTHFHDDCLGGLKAFDEHKISSYAYFKTIEFAKANNYTVPLNSFSDSLVLKVGTETIHAKFYGEGHTRDNIVCYFPSENVLFGGCLIREIDASRGYVDDGNVNTWSATVENVKRAHPNVKLVVPGHGDYGDVKLLDYTIQLFKNP